MIDHTSVNKWLADYVAAWKSSDPQAIAALFSENATYKFNPYDADFLHGRDAIVASWVQNPKSPDTFFAEYKAIAVDGNTAVANGRTLYHEPSGKVIRQQFDNIFVLRFDNEGRCTEFTEWFMQPR